MTILIPIPPPTMDNQQARPYFSDLKQLDLLLTNLYFKVFFYYFTFLMVDHI